MTKGGSTVVSLCWKNVIMKMSTGILFALHTSIKIRNKKYKIAGFILKTCKSK